MTIIMVLAWLVTVAFVMGAGVELAKVYLLHRATVRQYSAEIAARLDKYVARTICFECLKPFVLQEDHVWKHEIGRQIAICDPCRKRIGEATTYNEARDGEIWF